jgi:hypothetical protein
MSTSSLDTLTQSSTTDGEDKYLVRQGVIDGAIRRSVAFESIYPIGSIVKHMNNTLTPTDRGFPGTWEVIEEEVALRITTQPGELGVVAGSNTVDTPLPSHNHTVDIEPAGGHSHTYSYYYDNPPASDDSLSSTELVVKQQQVTSTTWVHNHKHTVLLNSEGESTPTIDIRGKHVQYVIWKRVS